LWEIKAEAEDAEAIFESWRIEAIGLGAGGKMPKQS